MKTYAMQGVLAFKKHKPFSMHWSFHSVIPHHTVVLTSKGCWLRWVLLLILRHEIKVLALTVTSWHLPSNRLAVTSPPFYNFLLCAILQVHICGTYEYKTARLECVTNMPECMHPNKYYTSKYQCAKPFSVSFFGVSWNGKQSFLLGTLLCPYPFPPYFSYSHITAFPSV